MNVLKIITGIVFLLLLLQGFAFINLMVSDKHEISIMRSYTETMPESNEKQKKLLNIEKRAKEIERQKRSTKIIALVLFIVLISLCLILTNGSRK